MIRNSPVLYVGQALEQRSCDRARLARRQGEILPAITEAADRGDDGTGTHAECLRDGSRLDIAHDLMDLDPFFRNLITKQRLQLNQEITHTEMHNSG